MAFNSFQKSRFKQFSPCFVRYERDEKDKKNGNFSIQKSGYQSPMKTHGIKKRNGLKTKRKSRPGCLAKSCVQESCFRHRRQKKPRHCFPDVLSHSNLPGCMQGTKVQSRVQKLSLTLFTSDFYRSQVKSLPHLTFSLFLFWIIFKCKVVSDVEAGSLIDQGGKSGGNQDWLNILKQGFQDVEQVISTFELWIELMQ